MRKAKKAKNERFVDFNTLLDFTQLQYMNKYRIKNNANIGRNRPKAPRIHINIQIYRYKKGVGYIKSNTSFMQYQVIACIKSGQR